MPSSDLARSKPSLASWLNERSLRPPMSVTRPTLIFFSSLDDDCELPLDELEDSSSEPHPTATRPQRQSVKITNRCTARRDGTSLPSKECDGSCEKRRQPTGAACRSPDLRRREENV